MSIFLFFAYFLLISAALLVFCSVSPTVSVCSLVVVFSCASSIFIYVGLDFIGFLFLIVYVGAIAIIFLFIVMLISTKSLDIEATTYFLLSSIIIFIIWSQVIYFLFLPTLFCTTSEYVSFASDSYFFYNPFFLEEFNRNIIFSILGNALFGIDFVIVICSGVLLLIAMIGSIHLTHIKSGFSMRRQYNQLQRGTRILCMHIF